MGKIITQTCNILGGGGGGKSDFARGAGVNKEKIGKAKEWVRKHITILLAREE
jgi:alanyl-tRNA synthetase